MEEKLLEIHQTFIFEQRPWWKESFDKTAEKKAGRKSFFFEKEFSKKLVLSFHAPRLWEMFAKELI